MKLTDGTYQIDHPDSDMFAEPRPMTFHGGYRPYIEKDGSLTYTVATTVCPSVRSDSGFITSTVTQTDNNNFQHICPNNPLRTCNCGDTCADKDFEPTDSPAKDDGCPCVVVGS